MDTSLFSKFIFIAFQLTIFFLLLFQLVSLAKQYIIPPLRRKVESVRKAWIDLQDKLKLKISTKDNIEVEIKEQSSDLRKFEEKIKEWHALKTEKISLRRKKYIERIDRLKKKKDLQLLSLRVSEAKHKVVPRAIEKASIELKKKYKDSIGKELLSKVIKSL